MAKKKANSRKPSAPLPKCGLVMPIAKTENCSERHWQEVKEIVQQALKGKFEVELVSEQASVDVIHHTIVTNLYENPLVIVDLSESNANVFFELGLRLAFDMPVVLIKDEQTSWKFDVSSIETLQYRRDLRHRNVEEFKKELREKATATFKRIQDDSSYSPFLRHFKKLERKNIPTEKVEGFEFLVKKIESLESSIRGQHEHVRSEAKVDSGLIFRNGILDLRSAQNLRENYPGTYRIVTEELSSLERIIFEAWLNNTTIDKIAHESDVRKTFVHKILKRVSDHMLKLR